MKSTGNIAILAFLLFFGTAPYASEISLQPQTGLALKMTDDFSFGIAGSMHTGPCLDQTENLVTPGDLNHVIIPFVEKGYNGWALAPWFEIKLAKISSIEIRGGGEVTIISRKTDTFPVIVVKSVGGIDSVDAPDFFEVRPAGIFSMSMPMGNFTNFTFSNRLERRLFRAPIINNNSISYFRYVAGLMLSAVPMTSLKIAPYAFYTGYTQKNSRHLSASGAGFTVVPAGALSFDIAYRIRWTPGGRNESEHQVGIDARYIFDFTK